MVERLVYTEKVKGSSPLLFNKNLFMKNLKVGQFKKPFQELLYTNFKLKKIVYLKKFKLKKKAVSAKNFNLFSCSVFEKIKVQKELDRFWRTSVPFSVKISKLDSSMKTFLLLKKSLVPRYSNELLNTKTYDILINSFNFKSPSISKKNSGIKTSNVTSSFFSNNLSKINYFLRNLNATSRYIVYKYLHAFYWQSKFITFLNLENEFKRSLSVEVFNNLTLLQKNVLLKYLTYSEFLFLCSVKRNMFFYHYNEMLANPDHSLKLFLGTSSTAEFMHMFKLTKPASETLESVFNKYYDSKWKKLFKVPAKNKLFFKTFNWDNQSLLSTILTWLLPFFKVNFGEKNFLSSFSRTNFLSYLKLSSRFNQSNALYIDMPIFFNKMLSHFDAFGYFTPVFLKGLTASERASFEINLIKRRKISQNLTIPSEFNKKVQDPLIIAASYYFLRMRTKTISDGSLEALNVIEEVRKNPQQDHLEEAISGNHGVVFTSSNFQFTINVQSNNFFCNFSKVSDNNVSKTIFKLSSSVLKNVHYSKKTARFWMKKLILQFFKRSFSWLKKFKYLKNSYASIEDRLNFWFNLKVPGSLNRFLITQIRRDFNYNKYNLFINFNPLLCFNGCRARTIQSKKRKGRVIYKIGGK